MFLHCLDSVEKVRAKAKGDEKAGVDIVAKALVSPTAQIVENTGQNGQVVVAEILERGSNVGFDASTGKYVNMVSAGIIDPAKVSRIALQNAASIASLLLTTNLMVTEYDEKSEEQIPGAIK